MVEHQPTIRLLQLQPSWAIHALLRFKNLPYISEDVPTNTVLGKSVPVLSDGISIESGSNALLHIQQQYSDGWSRNELIADHILGHYLMNTIENTFQLLAKTTGYHEEVVSQCSSFGISWLINNSGRIKKAIYDDR